jgi:uncharacterized membrane protein
LRRGFDLLWPNDVPGLIALVCALPPLFGLMTLLRSIPADAPCRLNRLAWFGGSTLFFITLIFPLQFATHPEVWTIAWALEGAALVWLYHRIPHPGLRVPGVALLVAVFVRLMLNPAVLDYALRSERSILNWILWTYGLAALSCFVAARLLAPPRDRLWGFPLPGLLATLGTILAFALMNLEIADYFTPINERLRLEFSGNFARDMTYTIGWAVFALLLVIAGALRKVQAARFAAIALFCVTVLKLLFHDLVWLAPAYRIGAFLAVAVIATTAAFVFQRFLRSQEKKP